MFLALTNGGQSKTMCLIESGSLHWLQRGCFSCFYNVKVGEVGMTNILILVLIISERPEAMSWVYHLVNFFLIDLCLFDLFTLVIKYV